MDPHSNTELAIGSIDLNADSHPPRKSPCSFFSFSYYRLFSAGNPISEFYCQRCNNSLGYIPPHRCDRCRTSVGDIGCSERRIVGFTPLTDGVMMGEYLIMTRVVG